jgi:hypothetical protein
MSDAELAARTATEPNCSASCTAVTNGRDVHAQLAARGPLTLDLAEPARQPIGFGQRSPEIVDAYRERSDIRTTPSPSTTRRPPRSDV